MCQPNMPRKKWAVGECGTARASERQRNGREKHACRGVHIAPHVEIVLLDVVEVVIHKLHLDLVQHFDGASMIR